MKLGIWLIVGCWVIAYAPEIGRFVKRMNTLARKRASQWRNE